MTLEAIFGHVGSIAMIGWVILIFAPRRWEWLNILPKIVLPLVLSLVYAAFILTYFAQSDGGYGSLAQVRALFSMDELLLAGWVHYLAFDLMIGGFMAEKMDQWGVHRIIQAPILLSTFMFGPVGVILAYSLRSVLIMKPSQNGEAAS